MNVFKLLVLQMLKRQTISIVDFVCEVLLNMYLV